MLARHPNPLPAARVLLADADPDTRELYCTALTANRYEVDEAEDGREALAKVFGFRPALLIAATRLPFIDGYQLCKLLRQDNDTRDTHIILVTSDARPLEFERAKAAGASAMLVTPCSTDTLLLEVQRLSERSLDLCERGDVARAKAATPRFESGDSPRPAGYAVRAHQRFATTNPALKPPALVCPRCDLALRYERSQVGGVNERNPEQWDYFVCKRGCGTFQYRQRTRKIRSVRT